MENQLQIALAEIISKTSKGVDASVSFLSDELPDVINQLLIWKATYSGAQFLTSITLAIVTVMIYLMAFKTTRRVEKEWKDESNHRREGDAYLVFFTLGTGFALTLEMIALAIFDLDWLQILIAPKVYLIEYAAKLIN